MVGMAAQSLPSADKPRHVSLIIVNGSHRPATISQKLPASYQKHVKEVDYTQRSALDASEELSRRDAHSQRHRDNQARSRSQDIQDEMHDTRTHSSEQNQQTSQEKQQSRANDQSMQAQGRGSQSSAAAATLQKVGTVAAVVGAAYATGGAQTLSTAAVTAVSAAVKAFGCSAEGSYQNQNQTQNHTEQHNMASNHSSTFNSSSQAQSGDVQASIHGGGGGKMKTGSQSATASKEHSAAHMAETSSSGAQRRRADAASEHSAHDSDMGVQEDHQASTSQGQRQSKETQVHEKSEYVADRQSAVQNTGEYIVDRWGHAALHLEPGAQVSVQVDGIMKIRDVTIYDSCRIVIYCNGDDHFNIAASQLEASHSPWVVDNPQDPGSIVDVRYLSFGAMLSISEGRARVLTLLLNQLHGLCGNPSQREARDEFEQCCLNLEPFSTSFRAALEAAESSLRDGLKSRASMLVDSNVLGWDGHQAWLLRDLTLTPPPPPTPSPTPPSPPTPSPTPPSPPTPSPTPPSPPTPSPTPPSPPTPGLHDEVPGRTLILLGTNGQGKNALARALVAHAGLDPEEHFKRVKTTTLVDSGPLPGGLRIVNTPELGDEEARDLQFLRIMHERRDVIESCSVPPVAVYVWRPQRAAATGARWDSITYSRFLAPGGRLLLVIMDQAADDQARQKIEAAAQNELLRHKLAAAGTVWVDAGAPAAGEIQQLLAVASAFDWEDGVRLQQFTLTPAELGVFKLVLWEAVVRARVYPMLEKAKPSPVFEPAVLTMSVFGAIATLLGVLVLLGPVAVAVGTGCAAAGDLPVLCAACPLGADEGVGGILNLTKVTSDICAACKEPVLTALSEQLKEAFTEVVIDMAQLLPRWLQGRIKRPEDWVWSELKRVERGLKAWDIQAEAMLKATDRKAMLDEFTGHIALYHSLADWKLPVGWPKS